MKAEIIFFDETTESYFRKYIKRAFKSPKIKRISDSKDADGNHKIVCSFEFELFSSPGGQPRKLTKSQTENFKKDYDSGMSKRSLMTKYNLSYSSVNNYLRRLSRM